MHKKGFSKVVKSFPGSKLFTNMYIGYPLYLDHPSTTSTKEATISAINLEVINSEVLASCIKPQNLYRFESLSSRTSSMHPFQGRRMHD